MNREPGYYWVKIWRGRDWQIARWNGTDWFFCGSEEDWPDDNIEVGPKIEPPQE